MVFCTLVQSEMDYATFLCPSRADALLAFDSLRQILILPGNKIAAISDISSTSDDQC